MASDSLSQRKAQLDKAEREHLEDAVTEMRERVEDNVAFQLTQNGLDESISDDCEKVSSEISSEWSDRALSEITTAGYQQNRKHGVEINITPLAEAEIVPKTVDDQIR